MGRHRPTYWERREEARRERRTAALQRQAQEEARRYEGERNTQYEKIAAAIQRIVDHNDSSEERQNAQDGRDRRRENWRFGLEIFGVVAAVIAAAGVIYQVGEMIRVYRPIYAQAVASKDSADAAKKAADIAADTLRASQRAWLKVKIAVGGSLTFAEDGSCNTAIAVTITNVGNTPATNITVHGWLIPIRSRGDFHGEEQRRRAEALKKAPVPAGFVLFPSDVFPQSVGSPQWLLGIGVTKQEMEEGIAANQNINPAESRVRLAVAGVIDYTFPTDAGRHHQTGFLFNLVSATGDFQRTPGTSTYVAQEALRLVEIPWDTGRYAD